MDPLKRVNILFNVLTMLQSSSALENEVGFNNANLDADLSTSEDGKFLPTSI